MYLGLAKIKQTINQETALVPTCPNKCQTEIRKTGHEIKNESWPVPITSVKEIEKYKLITIHALIFVCKVPVSRTSAWVVIFHYGLGGPHPSRRSSLKIFIISTQKVRILKYSVCCTGPYNTSLFNHSLILVVPEHSKYSVKTISVNLQPHSFRYGYVAPN